MLPRLAVLFHRIGPYHRARLTEAAKHGDLVAVQFSNEDRTYLWERLNATDAYQTHTLFSNADIDSIASPAIFSEMGAVLSALKVDVVAIPGWSHRAALAALYWASASRTPALVMSDSNEFDARRSFWREAVKRRVVRRFGAALVAGTTQMQYLSTLGMPADNIFIGYDVVDNEYFECGSAKALADAPTSRNSLGLPHRYFLASARFVVSKNLSNLIRAYARYRNISQAPWDLVILGDGGLRGEITEEIRRLDMAGHVLLPGFKQYAELPLYHGLASAFVHASVVEQWGLVVNEAMASGLPVLVSNRCGCAADLVEEGRNGYTFDPADIEHLAALMKNLSSDEVSLAKMSSASREIIKTFSLRRFSESLWKAAEASNGNSRIPFGLMDRMLLHALMRR